MKRKNKKEEWVDDGRTIADMSGITRRNLLIPRPFPEELKEQEEERSAAAVSDAAASPEPAEPSEGPEASDASPAATAASSASPEGTPIDPEGDLPGKRTGSRTPVSVMDEDGLISDPEEINRRRPWENSSSADKKETFWYVLGTLSAGLLLVLLFIAAGGIIILLMLALWS